MRGDVNFLPMTSEFYGIPQHLKEKGIVPLFEEGGRGWDGQFYYFIANDLFDQKGTAQHIDSAPYRYQRPGVGIWALGWSKILAQDWVSPSVYLLSYVLLFVFGAFCLSKLYLQFNIPLAWVLAWSCFVTTHVTIFNFLPDAGADCFIFIGLYFLFVRKSRFISSLAFSLACLSREVYLLLPFSIFCYEVYFIVKNSTIKNLFRIDNFFKLVLASIPGIIFLSWHIWIVLHFGKVSNSEADGILSWPVVNWLYYSVHAPTLLGSLSLITFFIIIIFSIFKFYKLSGQSQDIWKPISWFVILVSIPYLCFDYKVLEHWAGYLKPAALYLSLFPFLIKFLNIPFAGKLKKLILFFLICSVAHLYFEKIITRYPDSIYSGQIRSEDKEEILDAISCFEKMPIIEIQKKDEILFYSSDFLKKLFFRPDISYYLFDIKNRDEKVIPIAKRQGDFSIKYDWIDPRGEVQFSGPNHFRLPHQLEVNASDSIKMAIVYPKNHTELTLRMSLFQHGCQ